MSNYWKLNPKERFHLFKGISADEKNEIINKLLKSCPEVNWPYGMPLSLCADLIFVGASPGSSRTDYKVDYKPTFDKAHGGIYYPDKKNYWINIRKISEKIIKSTIEDIVNLDPFIFLGHMNLSTEEQGQAKNVVVKSSMASWVAEIIGLLRPTCVLLNGLMGHLKGESFNLFNYKTNTIDWKKAEKEIYIKDINNKNIIIRIWRRHNTFFIMLPNHTGKPPMTNQDSKNKVFTEIIKYINNNR